MFVTQKDTKKIGEIPRENVNFHHYQAGEAVGNDFML